MIPTQSYRTEQCGRHPLHEVNQLLKCRLPQQTSKGSDEEQWRRACT
jgi:hypothetical protein